MDRSFQLLADFTPSRAPFEFDEDDARRFVPLLVARSRFEHEYYYSTVVMKAPAREETFALAF
jgi:hypothetical protein